MTFDFILFCILAALAGILIMLAMIGGYVGRALNELSAIRQHLEENKKP